MGHPKKQRRKYEKPFRPYDKQRIEEEKKLMKEFGLRRKKEIWRAQSILRNFRRRARDLQASRDEEKEKELIGKLYRMGLLPNDATLDDVLELKVEDILSRRLQTIVYKKGLANTPKQARQFIVHGHILANGKKLTKPGHLIERDLEDKIKLSPKLSSKLLKKETKETKKEKIKREEGENNA